MTARPSLSLGPADRAWRVVALAVVIAGALVVASTYLAFSNTYDEPAHIAAGMQRIASGRYDYDIRRPPLACLGAAIGPYLSGDRPFGAASADDEGARILGRGAHYRTTLALARLGELPFFLLLCGVLWTWGRRLTDERGGAIAVLLTATNPNVLAHAGLATTDIALAATMSASLFAFVAWLDSPYWATSVALGAAVALAATTDYSALVMLMLAFPAIYLTRGRATSRAAVFADIPRWKATLVIALACVAAIVCGWAVYGFQRGPLGSVTVPAPDWFRGLWSFVTDSSPARPAFLFGQRSSSGWWYYYPLALLVKTPLPLLMLAVLGVAAGARDLVRRDGWHTAALAAGTAAIVAAATIGGDDSGVRLVLPLFGLLALLGTVAVAELWERSATSTPARRLVHAAVATTLALAAIVPMRIHPDYLAYFNPLAGDRPEMILVDSNLDWGQDLYRLGDVMKRMRIDSVAVAYYGSASFDAAGVRHARALAAAERPTGWIAASQTMLAGVGGDGAFEWLNELQPVGRVGASLVLYYVPPRRRYR